MSHSRKHLVEGALQDFPVPEDEQQIARVTEMRGSNIVEVEQRNGEKILCLMPAKFKKTLWIKRGNFLIIEPFTEVVNKTDKKLRARIATVLFPNHIKYLERQGLWPDEWKADAGTTATAEPATGDDDGEDEEDPYLVNPNHRRTYSDDDEDESDSEDEDESDSD